MDKKYTVTIGIPAHNEERNLPRLLDSILVQKQEGYQLDRVIVACDGCTDGTNAVATSYYPKLNCLQIIDDGQRFGQAYRMEQMMRSTKSDIYVSLDADTVLGTSESLKILVAAFSDPTVGLVAGEDRPHQPRTFFESVAVTVVDLWRSIRTQYNNGDTIHNSHGCALALSRAYADVVELPKNINGADNFLYLKAKELGFAFRYGTGAVVLYHEPSSFSEYIMQRGRFNNIQGNMEQIFGEKVRIHYAPLPRLLKLKAVGQMLLNRPLLTPLALLLEEYSRFCTHIHKPAPQGAVWQTIKSTK